MKTVLGLESIVEPPVLSEIVEEVTVGTDAMVEDIEVSDAVLTFVVILMSVAESVVDSLGFVVFVKDPVSVVVPEAFVETVVFSEDVTDGMVN